MSSTTHSIPSFYAVIPANVRYNKNLEPNAKLLYGEITALCSKEGYCWASDEYFKNLYDVKINTVQRWLKSLEEEGFITRVSDNKSFKKNRKIYISDGLKKCLRIHKNEKIDIHKNENHINTTYINKEISPKGEIKKEPNQSTSSPILPPSRKNTHEPKKTRADRVNITDTQHEALLKRCQGNHDLVERWYKKLSDWKIGKQKCGGNDYLTIIKWVITAVEEDSYSYKNQKTKKGNEKCTNTSPLKNEIRPSTDGKTITLDQIFKE